MILFRMDRKTKKISVVAAEDHPDDVSPGAILQIAAAWAIRTGAVDGKGGVLGGGIGLPEDPPDFHGASVS